MTRQQREAIQRLALWWVDRGWVVDDGKGAFFTIANMQSGPMWDQRVAQHQNAPILPVKNGAAVTDDDLLNVLAFVAKVVDGALTTENSVVDAMVARELK